MSKNTLPRQRRAINKEKAFAHLGGKRCARGGATHLPSTCYDFHHNDTKNEKESNISTLIGKRWTKHLERELDKCIILCSNCHRIFHEEVRKRLDIGRLGNGCIDQI